MPSRTSNWGGCLYARGVSSAKMGNYWEINKRWALVLAGLLLLGMSTAKAQSPAPTGADAPSVGNSIQDPSSPDSNTSSGKSHEQAQQPAAKPGNIVGTILDQSGTVAPGAVVRLTSEDKSFSQQVVSGDNGQFSFSKVPSGSFRISVPSAGCG